MAQPYCAARGQHPMCVTVRTRTHTARRLALTLGRTVGLALLARHAQWSLDEERDVRALAAARRFAAHGVSLIAELSADDARMLARDEPE